VAISWRALVTRAAERTAKLPVAAVARHHHQQGQGLLPAHVRPQGARLIEVAREPLHLAAPIPELALHQIASRRVDGGRAIELLEDRVLRGPEAHGVDDRLAEGTRGVIEDDRVAEREEGRVLGKRVADRVDEVESRGKMLVDGRPRDPGPLGHVL
jgi:hypothetical protein